MSKLRIRNVLFLVTGMTPAIITETIWALACDPSLEPEARWIPDEIHVLSTTHGLNQIRARLIQNKVFETFIADYPQLSQLSLNEQTLYSINDAAQQPIGDLKTPTDNEYAADAIHEHIRQLTADPETALHVSIAGGRKTMGFYAGYALSLHGRAQDRMSHVLVDERFESLRDFFYPTPYQHYVLDRDNRSWDASTAQVWLADIPFVRMKEAIKERHQLLTNSFSDTVQKINEAHKDLHIRLHLKEKTLTVNHSIVVDDLPPKEFALLYMFAHNRKQGHAGFTAPRYNLSDKNIPIEAVKYINELSQIFLEFYSPLRDPTYLDDKNVDVGKGYFDTTKSTLNRHLQEALGLELAAKIAIQADKRNQPFYLNINPEAIELV